MVSIDDIDRRLIRSLQEDARASYATIARQVGVSETTAKRRIEALIEARVIVPTIIPDLPSLGYEAAAIVLLKVELVRILEIAETLRQMPEVANVALALGRCDLTVGVMLQSPNELTQFLITKVVTIPGVLDTETIMTPRYLKFFADWRMPLGEYDGHRQPATNDQLRSSVKRS